jgi:XTP/dITP diphosphohydrolase
VIELIIATRNAHKVHEIQTVLSSGFRCRNLKDFPGAPEVIEDADTFAGNATKKSLGLARWLAANPRLLIEASKPGEDEERMDSAVRAVSFWCLADDSGLEVDALAGAPGVHSARFAALDSGNTANSPDAANNAKLLRLLSQVPPAKRTGRFRCVIAVTPILMSDSERDSRVCYADESEWQTETFDGACEGRILSTPRGGHGFGYDPLFVPDGYDEAFAELGEDIKNRISHRAKALAELKRAWQQTLNQSD